MRGWALWRRTGLILIGAGCKCCIWVHLIDLPSIPLRCNGFARIQKAVVDQMGSRSPNSDHDLCGANLACALEELLGPATELVIAGFHI